MKIGAEKLIGIVERNNIQDIRVRLVELDNGTFVDVRVYTAVGPTERVPTKKGVTFRPALLPKLIEKLQTAEREAKAAGLISEAGAGRGSLSDVDAREGQMAAVGR